MMAELWLLRHGDAEPAGAGSDELRALTEKGRRQAHAAGLALSRLGARFELVVSSPRVRALETARTACAALGAEATVHEPLSAGFGRDEALTLLAGLSDGGWVLAVGHEPDFSQTVHDLTGARIDLKKGGLAMVLVDGPRGQLRLLLRPAELAAIAADSSLGRP